MASKQLVLTKTRPEVSPAALSTADAAIYLGIGAAGTLQNWRSLGQGPAYVKAGGKVVYRVVDLDAWLASNLVGAGR